MEPVCNLGLSAGRGAARFLQMFVKNERIIMEPFNRASEESSTLPDEKTVDAKQYAKNPPPLCGVSRRVPGACSSKWDAPV